MVHTFKLGVALLLAVLLSGCETTSTNRVASQAAFSNSGGTGVVIFATQSDGSESYLSYTSGMGARLYDPSTACTRNIPGEERDHFRISGGDLNSVFNVLPVGRGLRWHLYQVLPGDYVVHTISRVRHFGNVTTNESIQVVGAGPVFTVREGQVTYAGNFSVSNDQSRLFRFLGHTLVEAQEHLATFPNLPQEIEEVPSRIVPLRPRSLCNALTSFPNLEALGK